MPNNQKAEVIECEECANSVLLTIAVMNL